MPVDPADFVVPKWLVLDTVVSTGHANPQQAVLYSTTRPRNAVSEQIKRSPVRSRARPTANHWGATLWIGYRQKSAAE